MRKATKIVISFAVVLIAGLNFIVPAFAQDPFTSIAIGGLTGASGAGLFGSMAGMSGIDIAWSQAGSDPMDAMWNVLNPDHVYFSGEKHEADPQTDPDDVWDYITVDLGDWLSAQSDFIVQFAQDYNVTDNDSGYTDPSCSYDGIPINSDKSSDIIATAYIPAQIGEFWIGSPQLGVLVEATSSYTYWHSYYSGTEIYTSSFRGFTTAANYFISISTGNITVPSSAMLWIGQAGVGKNWRGAGTLPGYTTIDTGVPYTSSTVDTHVFDGWENAKVKIPHSISGLSPNWTIPEFLGAINNLWTQNQQGQIVIEDTDQPVPPPPVPTTPLGEMPFDDWVDLWGQGIYQQLENQSDTLDLIGSNGIDAIEELESIDTNTEDLVETAESIDTNIGIGNGILGGIRSLAQSAVDYLEGIAEHVGELVEEIVEGTETLIAGILNQIPQVFSVIFGPIKQASSIWHYVVEWITSIGAPFQFIWSMASGTSYYIILPVYASLAAAVVLAFYKRFGK